MIKTHAKKKLMKKTKEDNHDCESLEGKKYNTTH